MIPYTFDPSIMSNKKKIKAAMKAMDENNCPFKDSRNVKMSQNISKFLKVSSFSAPILRFLKYFDLNSVTS